MRRGLETQRAPQGEADEDIEWKKESTLPQVLLTALIASGAFFAYEQMNTPEKQEGESEISQLKREITEKLQSKEKISPGERIEWMLQIQEHQLGLTKEETEQQRKALFERLDRYSAMREEGVPEFEIVSTMLQDFGRHVDGRKFPKYWLDPQDPTYDCGGKGSGLVDMAIPYVFPEKDADVQYFSPQYEGDNGHVRVIAPIDFDGDGNPQNDDLYIWEGEYPTLFNAEEAKDTVIFDDTVFLEVFSGVPPTVLMEPVNTKPSIGTAQGEKINKKDVTFGFPAGLKTRPYSTQAVGNESKEEYERRMKEKKELIEQGLPQIEKGMEKEFLWVDSTFPSELIDISFQRFGTKVKTVSLFQPSAETWKKTIRYLQLSKFANVKTVEVFEKKFLPANIQHELLSQGKSIILEKEKVEISLRDGKVVEKQVVARDGFWHYVD